MTGIPIMPHPLMPHEKIVVRDHGAIVANPALLDRMKAATPEELTEIMRDVTLIDLDVMQRREHGLVYCLNV